MFSMAYGDIKSLFRLFTSTAAYAHAAGAETGPAPQEERATAARQRTTKATILAHESQANSADCLKLSAFLLGSPKTASYGSFLGTMHPVHVILRPIFGRRICFLYEWLILRKRTKQFALPLRGIGMTGRGHEMTAACIAMEEKNNRGP
jgi:hypothetical protein